MNKSESVLESVFFRFSVMVVVFLYFVFGSYWLYVTARYTPHIISGFPRLSELLRENWWIVTYYSSELFLSAGIVLRWIAGVIALYAAVILLMKGKDALSLIRKKVGVAVFLEGLYVLTYAPSAFLGLVYPIAASRGLWYFEPTPPWTIVLLVNGLACTAMVVLIAPCIFKLWLKIHGGSGKELVRWACVTGIAYLFAMFWWNYTMAWAATLIYWPERAQLGIEILYNPVAAASFVITALGLLLVAVYALKVLLPAIRGSLEKFELQKLGYLMLFFSCYFIVMLILYAVAGGYSAQPTTWMEIIGPHNPDLWCTSLILPAAYLILKYGKNTQLQEPTISKAS